MGTRRIFGAVCIGAAVAVASTGLSAADMEPWEHVLAQQLDLEQKCTMQNTYSVQRFQVGEEMTLKGKAHCYDGRDFDFSQKKNHMKFEIRACDPTLC